MVKTNTPRSVLFTVSFCGFVIAAVLLTAILLRPSADGLPSGDSAAPGLAGRVDCGSGPCQVLASEKVGDASIDLLADSTGEHGKVRIVNGGASVVFETTITTMGVRLTKNSLTCDGGANPACLMSGSYDQGVVGEVFVSRGGNWRSTEKPYFSDAGSIVLSDVIGDSTPEVVRVRHDCGDSGISTATCQVKPVYAEVFDLSGKQLGCTKKYTAPAQIRGWPEVRILPNELRACP